MDKLDNYKECKLCIKKFTQPGTLKRHIRHVHEDLKSKKCDYCDINFSQSQNLNDHIHTVHEGKKDYKCKLCTKLFTTTWSLKMHAQNIHEDQKQIFACDTCDKEFQDTKILRKQKSSEQ